MLNQYDPYNIGWNPNQPQQNPYNRPQMKQYTFVDGIDGAKAYQMMPNQSMLLMDRYNCMCYMKTSDMSGKSSVRYFKMEEVDEETAREFLQPQPAPKLDFASKSDIDNINTRLDELFKMLSNQRPNRNNKDTTVNG